MSSTNKTKTNPTKSNEYIKALTKTEIKKEDKNLKNKITNPTNSIKQSNKNGSLAINNENKNIKNNTIDIKQKFADIEEFYNKFKSGSKYEDLKIQIVSINITKKMLKKL